MSAWRDARARAAVRWRELPVREQRLVWAAGGVVALALLWWIALAPALRTISGARAAHAQLDVQLQQMRALQAQARALQALPRANREDALRALEASVNETLGGSVRMQASGGNAGEGVVVTLRATPASNFAQWLTQARGNARALPREIHVTRSQSAPPGGTAGPGPAGGLVGGPGARFAPPPGGPVPPAAGTAEALGARWDGTLVMSLPAR